MADNTRLDVGTGGDLIATDDDGTAKHQQVKVEWGADGTFNATDAASGKALPVQGEAAENAATTGNPVLTGGRYDATPRTLGDGDVGAVALDADGAVQVSDGGNSLTVDGTVTANLSATDNAVLDVIAADTTSVDGKITACDTGAVVLAASDGTDIGDVDVASIAAGDNNIGNVDLVTVGSVVDSNNSTTTPLGGAAAFTGTGTDLLGYTAVCSTLYADVDSATDGMTFQFSSDNSNWDDVYTFTMDVSSSDCRRFQFPVCARYFRIVYTNGAGAQSAFRVQTILHTGNQNTSLHRLVDDVSPDRSAQVNKSAIIAQAAGNGNFVPVQATAGGNLKASIEESVALDVSAATVTVDLGANNDVQGVVAEGAAVTGTNPFLIAGDDGTNVKNLGANASGHLQVDIATDSVGIGGGTQYTEDAAAAADPVGNAPILIRKDTPATITDTDGDNVAQRGTNYGAAYVQVVDSSGNYIDTFGGSGGTSHADDAAFSIGGASSITPTGYLADDTTPDSVDEGDVGVPRMTLTRKPYAVITDPTSENNAAVDGSGHLQCDIAASSATVTVDGSGVTQPVSISDTSFAVADGNALGEGVLIQGDDGTDRKNINVDATTGDVQVDVTNTVTVGSHDVTNAGTFATQATLQTGANTIGEVTIGAATTAAGDLAKAEDAVHASGDVGVMPLGVRNDTLAALAGTDGDYAPLQVNALGGLYVQLAPATTGGLSFFKSIDLDESEEEVKATAGQIYGIFATNTNAAVRFLKVYNATAASVTVGTTTPDMTFQIPPDNGGLFLNLPHGIAMSTAITVAATTGVADNDSGAPGANEIVCTVLYK